MRQAASARPGGQRLVHQRQALLARLLPKPAHGQLRQDQRLAGSVLQQTAPMRFGLGVLPGLLQFQAAEEGGIGH